jgi:hypothetical protein
MFYLNMLGMVRDKTSQTSKWKLELKQQSQFLIEGAKNDVFDLWNRMDEDIRKRYQLDLTKKHEK